MFTVHKWASNTTTIWGAYIATDDTWCIHGDRPIQKFPTKAEAIEYARGLLHSPTTEEIYVQGPKGGKYGI